MIICWGTNTHTDGRMDNQIMLNNCVAFDHKIPNKNLMSIVNSLPAKSCYGGETPQNPVGFYSRNSTESTLHHKHNNHKHHHHGGAVCPSYGVGSMDTPDRTRRPSSEGVGREGGRRELFKSLNQLSNKIKTSQSIIYDVMDSTAIATTMPPGRYGARHISQRSTTRASCEATGRPHWACARAVSARGTPWSLSSSSCENTHKTQLLASVYRTFLLAKLSNFVTRKGT